jgi:hypothetical protein
MEFLASGFFREKIPYRPTHTLNYFRNREDIRKLFASADTALMQH